MRCAAATPACSGPALSNDLQPAALDLQPRLRLLLEAGLEYGALGAMVSGSGPTCAFLAESESSAVDLSVALSADGLCRAVRRTTGPVRRRVLPADRPGVGRARLDGPLGPRGE